MLFVFLVHIFVMALYFVLQSLALNNQSFDFSAILKRNTDGFKMNVRGADVKLAPFRVRRKLCHFGRVNGECHVLN